MHNMYKTIWSGSTTLKLNKKKTIYIYADINEVKVRYSGLEEVLRSNICYKPQPSWSDTTHKNICTHRYSEEENRCQIQRETNSNQSNSWICGHMELGVWFSGLVKKLCASPDLLQGGGVWLCTGMVLSVWYGSGMLWLLTTAHELVIMLNTLAVK